MILQSVPEQLTSIAHRLLTYAGNQKIFLLEGVMGAGKTTLVKALCKALGSTDIVNSPTFTLLNEYHAINGTILYHFDCYRIEDIDNAIGLDFEDYFFSGHYCFIEWPEKIKPILPLHYCLIDITIETTRRRKLTCHIY